MNMDLVKDFFKFATLGVTTEVIFTAICDVISAKKNNLVIDRQLKGNSYIWMIPIYGSIALFARLLFPLVAQYHILLRAFIYGVVILIVEYIAGFIIRKLTGRCPWHYESKWAIHNLIRLDYMPLWMVFGIGVEFYYLYF
jgi:uncharacterized membrane protein